MRKTIVLPAVMVLLLSLGCAGSKVIEDTDNKGLAAQWYKKGNEYVSERNFVKAIEAYTTAITYDPEYTNAYTNRGNAFIEEIGPCIMAFKDFTKAIELQPDSSDAYRNRGYLYLKLKEFDKAVGDLTRSIELDNKSADVYLNRGKAFFYANERDKALNDINKAIELDAELANAYNFRGIVLISDNGTDNTKQAMADFKKGCEKGDHDACNNLDQVEKSMKTVPEK